MCKTVKTSPSKNKSSSTVDLLTALSHLSLIPAPLPSIPLSPSAGAAECTVRPAEGNELRVTPASTAAASEQLGVKDGKVTSKVWNMDSDHSDKEK